MNIRYNSTIAVAAWLALGVLCVPAAADGVPAPRAIKHGSSTGQGAMTAATRKSNDSGVAIQYRIDGAVRVGRPVSVFLQFDGVTDPAGATARLTTDAGLVLTTSSSFALPAGQRTTATATVTSSTDGLAYLNVFVTQNGAMSIVAIPVQTGSGTPVTAPAGEMKASGAGEKIISLPAIEPKEPPVKP